MKSSHITWLIVILIIAGAIAAVVLSKDKDSEGGQIEKTTSVSESLVTTESSEEIVFGEVIEFERQNPDHVLPNDEYETHNSNPPNSGAHLAQAPGWGIYKKPLTDLQAVHSLEHGGIWISYQPELNEDMIKELKGVVKQNPLATIMSPRVDNPTPIAITSWGRIMYLDAPNVEKIQIFIDSFKNDTHEPLAGLGLSR